MYMYVHSIIMYNIVERLKTTVINSVCSEILHLYNFF